MCCTNPIILVNSMAKRLWNHREYVIINGNKSYITSLSLMHHLSGYIKNGKRIEEPEEIDRIVKQNYIVVNGTRINCYISAPCGRCIYCKDSKRREYESRALFEAADNPNMYFFTLTYSDDYLPIHGLDKHDTSKFLKRFRETLARRYSEKFNVSLKDAREYTAFRCLYVGEYGVDPRFTQRPHYHGIFFFKNPLPDKYIPWLYNIFKSCWNKGKIFDFQKIRNPAAAARYVTKYITKQDLSHVPEGKNPCFIQGPSKNGGLGANNIVSHLDDILNSTNNCIYLRIGSSVVRVKIPKFVLQKIFPTFCRCFPSLQDKFYDMDQIRSEMICRIETDPFTFCFDPRKYDDVLRSFDYLRLGFTKQISDKHRVEISPTLDAEKVVSFFKGYTDTELNHIYLATITWMSSNLPTEEEFFHKFSQKLVWQNNLEIPDLTFEERLCKNEKIRFNNENFVRKRMLNENFDLSLLLQT